MRTGPEQTALLTWNTAVAIPSGSLRLSGSHCCIAFASSRLRRTAEHRSTAIPWRSAEPGVCVCVSGKEECVRVCVCFREGGVCVCVPLSQPSSKKMSIKIPQES